MRSSSRNPAPRCANASTAARTVVFVSHGDAQIQQICDRALWIEHGRSMMQGRVDDVLAAYHAALQAGPRRRTRR